MNIFGDLTFSRLITQKFVVLHIILRGDNFRDETFSECLNISKKRIGLIVLQRIFSSNRVA